MQWRLDWLPAVVTRLQQIRNSTLNFESTVDSCLTVRKVYAMERGALAGRPAWVGGYPGHATYFFKLHTWNWQSTSARNFNMYF